MAEQAEVAAETVPVEVTEAPAADVEMTVAATEGDAAPTEAEAAPSSMLVTPPPPAPEPLKELELDDVEDKRAKLAGEIMFATADMTLNVMPSVQGNVLMALTDGGMQYLLAGARANCGLKAGRYFFEAKIVEILDPTETAQRGRTPLPRQLVRIGFSTAASSLFLGDSEDSVCFDSEGFFTHNGKATNASQKFNRESVLGVVLNLDDKSANANTISLFRDGVRVSQPQPLPDCLKGKTLFPTLTWRNVTLAVNFGAEAGAEMPFKCRMLGDAAKADTELVVHREPANGQYKVVFPVCIPDQGTFDWLDMWLAQNPDYTELSDRALLNWCEKSGVSRQRGYGWKSCNDKPDMSTGIPQIDDFGVRKIINTIAAAHKRNFVVMEVKGNLLAPERKELLSRFSSSSFQKVAQVMMGEPKADFKKKVLELLLKEKQEKSDGEFKVKKAEEVRKRLADTKEKELALEQRKKERAARKAEREAKKAAAEAQKAEGGEAQPPGRVVVDEEMKAEDEDEEEEVVAPAAADDEKPPTVELTAEEKTQAFRKFQSSDLSPVALAFSFGAFILPEKVEGFDEVQYEWSPVAKCTEYLKDWKQNLKMITRVEDIQPGQWFSSQYQNWQSALQKWKAKHSEWKASALDRDNDAANKADGVKKEGEELLPVGRQHQDVNMTASDDDLDVFGVVDVCDIGKGEPLCAHFTFEDWALLSLRFELHVLAHAFQKDVKDDDRAGMHVDNLTFYYTKYFKRTLNIRGFGVETVQEMLTLVKDSVILSSKSVIEAQLSTDLDNCDVFLKLTEDSRRDRSLLVDSGDASAELKFNQAIMTGSAGGKSGHHKGHHKGSMGGKGFGDYGKGFDQGKGWGGDQGKGFGGDKGFQGPKGGNFGGKGDFGGNKGNFGGKGDQMGKGGYGGDSRGKGDQQYGQKRPYDDGKGKGGGYGKGYGK